jgi:hypothetical protein
MNELREFSISSYEEYQSGISMFWDNINEVKGLITYSSKKTLVAHAPSIVNKINRVSSMVSTLEDGKIYKKEGDGNIDFREIFFLILAETKQLVGTATLDKADLSFNYPFAPSDSTYSLKNIG